MLEPHPNLPETARQYVERIANNDVFTNHIRKTDDVDSLCDKLVAEAKVTAEELLSCYREAPNEAQKKLYLNTGAVTVGIIDEIRRDFNEGGQLFDYVCGLHTVQERATEGSSLAKAIRARAAAVGEEQNQAADGEIKVAKEADGFSAVNQPIVNVIRTQDRGDGIKYSVAKHPDYEGASLDVEYFSAICDMENAKTDAEREAARQELVKMVEQKAKDAGFENAIPEQTLAYATRTKAAPKKTKKVYKVFTVTDDGVPTALFVSSKEELPQNVWLDAKDTFHFKDNSNGLYYIPSTKNPSTKGGKTYSRLVDLSNVDKEDVKKLVEMGENSHTIGIHLSGDFEDAEPTAEQLDRCGALVADICDR